MSIRRDHLRNARLASGLTALDLAEAAGLREHTVYSVERGRCCCSAAEGMRWAQVLGVRFEEAFPELCSDHAGGGQ